MQTITKATAMGSFAAGFEQGYSDAELGPLCDLERIIARSPHYAYGYSRGVVACADPGRMVDVGAAWGDYVEWLHEHDPRLAADLVTVVEVLLAA